MKKHRHISIWYLQPHGKTRVGIVDALKENLQVMCVILLTSINVCEAKVEFNHKHDILCYCWLPDSIGHNVLTLNASFNVGAVNCPNAFLVTTVLLNNWLDIWHKRQYIYSILFNTSNMMHYSMAYHKPWIIMAITCDIWMMHLYCSWTYHDFSKLT